MKKVPKKHKLPCIYKATSKTTGKSYIGQSITGLAKRKRNHLHDAKSISYSLLNKFHKAIVNLGPEDFVWSILYIVRNISLDKKEIINRLNQKESYYVNKFNSIKEGYNTVKGGGSVLKKISYSKEEMEERLQIFEQKKQKLQILNKKPGKAYLEARKIRDSQPDRKARKKFLRDLRHNTPEYRAKRKAYRESPEAKIKRQARLENPLHKEIGSLKRKSRRLKEKLELSNL